MVGLVLVAINSASWNKEANPFVFSPKEEPRTRTFRLLVEDWFSYAERWDIYADWHMRLRREEEIRS
jgi:hypothetical protein